MLPRLNPALSRLLAVLILIVGVSAARGQALSEYKAFDYVRNPDTGLMERVEVSSAEYEERQKAMETALKTVISQVLMGTFEPTPEFIETGDENPLTPLINHPNFLLLPRELTSEERQRLQQAQSQGRGNAPEQMTEEQRLAHVQERLTRLFAVPDEVQGRLKDNPEYLDEVADSMAAWTIYYLNLSNWNTYVAQSILTKDLDDDEKPQYDPSIATEDRDTVYANLQQGAQEKTQEEEQAYASMVSSIQKDRIAQTNYEDWLRSRENEMIAFAQKWMRRYEGTELEIGDTVYLVRSYAERPKSGEEDNARDYLPANGVLVEVPRKKIVTPFDLIQDDGAMRKPE